MTYDPNDPPPREDWQALSEGEQVLSVREYHRNAGADVPNLQLHAIVHAIIENQVVRGEDSPVPDALAHLQEDGLTRHEAIHAVADVLMEHMDALMDSTGAEAFDVDGYHADVRALMHGDAPSPSA